MIDTMHDKTAKLRLIDDQPPGVAILVLEGVNLFELGVASDIFGTDITTDSGRPLYRRFICAPGMGIGTAQTSATYTGAFGHTYGLFSVTTDRAGTTPLR